MSVYLLDTPASYYFRIKVPKDLRSVLQKREIKLSLKTDQLNRARRLAALYASHWHEVFERMRGNRMIDPLINATWLKNANFERTPDGTIRFTADEIDPNNKDAEIEMANAIIEKLSSIPLAPIVQTTQTTQPDTMLSAAIEDYICAKGVSWDKSYTSNARSTFNIALRLLGNKPITDYTEEDRNSFYETIKKLPISWDKRNDFKGMSIPSTIEANEVLIKAPTTSTRTQKAYLNRMRWLFDWLISKKKYQLSDNPFDGITFPKEKADSEERDQFTTDELSKIFNQPIFTNLTYNEPFEYFLLLMGLFSGCRMNELAQMLLSDIGEQDGIKYLTITQKGSDQKKVKKCKQQQDNTDSSEIGRIGI